MAACLFVIEDWSCQLEEERALTQNLQSNPEAIADIARRLEAGEVPPPAPDPLARLIVDLVLTAGCSDEIVSEVVDVRRGWVVVRRGRGEIDPKGFEISQCYGNLGRGLLRA